MSRKEFIESLREYLSYELPERLVNENVRKYEEYFDEKIREGKTAQDVFSELGDPKLIARSLIDAEKSGADGIPNSDDDPDFAAEIDRENTQGRKTDKQQEPGENAAGKGNTRVYTSKGCLIPILILIFILILIIIFFASGIWIWVCLGALIISAVTAIIQAIRRK